MQSNPIPTAVQEIHLGSQIEITMETIDYYRSVTASSVTKIKWEAGPLDVQVLQGFPNLQILTCLCNKMQNLNGLEGCPQLLELTCWQSQLETLNGIENCPQLRYFDCSINRLTTLTGIENCLQLEHLNCACNTLTALTGIGSCTKLTSLECANNQLTSLNELSTCIYLQNLRCGFNRIKTIDGIRRCRRLTELVCYNNLLVSLAGIEGCKELYRLNCSSNGLTSITEVGYCPSIRYLDCSCNTLTVLTGIERCQQLTELRCSSNELTSLAGIERCLKLVGLQCSFNRLTSLEQVVYLPHLYYISDMHNCLEVQSIQVQRRLSRIKMPFRGETRSVYNDAQNVHNIHIQKTVCESIQNLLKDPKPELQLMPFIESGLPERALRLLLEYGDDGTIHSHHLLTFKELLAYVWARINRSEHRTELIKILGEQITDSECMCLTGRFNRVVSVLVGFYPDIMITISDSSRIGAIIIAARDQTLNPTAHRELAHKLLIEAGYLDEEVQPWLEAIDD